MNALAVQHPATGTDLLADRRVAIVAERLIDMRGGERVVANVAAMLPHADIFAAVVDPVNLPDLGGRRVKTSFVQGLPLSKKLFRAYLPLYPLAIEQLDLRRYDVVISLSSAFAHGVLTSPETTHICYCHSPLRFAWNYQHAYSRTTNPAARSIAAPLLHYIRSWDVAASHRVDSYVANSRNVQHRLWKYYRRESTVVHPPVDVWRFTPAGTPSDYFLIVSSLNAHKRIDIAVAAFSRLGLPLVIAGTGPDEARLRSRAADNIRFLGRVSDERLAELYAECRAFVFTSDEDFGIAPVEAQASGRPVIALRRGGALETVREGVTGVFFSDQSAASLERTIRTFDPDVFRPAAIRDHALRFSGERFEDQFGRYLAVATEPTSRQTDTWPRLQVL